MMCTVFLVVAQAEKTERHGWSVAVRKTPRSEACPGYLLAREDPPPSGGGMKARNEEPRHACGFLRLRRLRSGLSRDTFSPCEKRKRLRGVATARTRPRSPPPLGGWETHGVVSGKRHASRLCRLQHMDQSDVRCHQANLRTFPPCCRADCAAAARMPAWHGHPEAAAGHTCPAAGSHRRWPLSAALRLDPRRSSCGTIPGQGG